MATNTDVLNRLITALTSNDPSWDISVGTPEYKILEAVAQEIAIAANNNTLQNFSFDVTTKYGSDLDSFCALFGIYRNYGKRATGIATFSTTTAGTPSGLLTLSGATGGTYGISYVNNTTTLPYNSNSTQIQSAISSILPNGTACSVSGSGPQYTISFTPALPPSSLSFNFSSLTPQDTTLSASWVASGGASSIYNIPIGTSIYAPSSATGTVPLYFQTTEPTQIQLGQSSVQTPIQAILPGSDGNLGAGIITALSSTLVGVTQVTNTQMSGGTDAETDAQLQQRWKNTVFKNLAGTEDQFLALAYNNPDTTRARVMGPQESNSEQLQIVTNLNPSPVNTLSKSTAANPISSGSYPFNSNQLGDQTGSASFVGQIGVSVTATWTASSGSTGSTITIPSQYASNSSGIYQGMGVTVNGSIWKWWLVGTVTNNSDGSCIVTMTPDTYSFPAQTPNAISAATVLTPITFSFSLPCLNPWPATGTYQKTPVQGIPTQVATVTSSSITLTTSSTASVTLSNVIGLPPTATYSSGAVRIFSGNYIYSIGYTGINGNQLTEVTASTTVTIYANDLVLTSSYNSSTPVSIIQNDLTNIYNNSPINDIDQVANINATYNVGILATDASGGYWSFYQTGNVYTTGYAVNTPGSRFSSNPNVQAYGAYDQVSATTGTVSSISGSGTLTSGTAVTINLSGNVPLASSGTVGYPSSPSSYSPGIIWYYSAANQTYYNVSYTGLGGSGVITSFTGCTLTNAFGAPVSVAYGSGDKIYLPNIQQALNMLLGYSQGWETSVLPIYSNQGATSCTYSVNFFQKNTSTTTPMVPVNFTTVNNTLTIQTPNLYASSGVAASWSAGTRVADLINAQILLSSPSPTNLTYTYTGSTSTYPATNPYSFTNTVSPVIPDAQYFYPQGLELLQSNYSSSSQQSTASPNVDYSYVVTAGASPNTTSSLSVNILNGNNYAWLYPGNVVDLTYYYTALASRNNPTAYNTNLTSGVNPGTISTNYVDVFVDGVNSTQITESTVLTPAGGTIAPGCSGIINSSNQTNWVLGDGVSTPSVGDVYYIFSQQPVIQPWACLYPNFISMQQGANFTPMYPYGGPINSSFPGADPTYSFTTGSEQINITPLSRISAIYYNMNIGLNDVISGSAVFPFGSYVKSYQHQNKLVTINTASTTSGSWVNVPFSSDFYPIYDATENAGSPQAINGIAIRQPYQNYRSGASYSSSSQFVSDTSALISDVGSIVYSGTTYIPTNTRVQSVIPGVGYTISQTPTGSGTGVSLIRFSATPTVCSPITNASNTTTVLTVNALNTFAVNETIAISGSSNPNYNRTWTVSTVVPCSSGSPYNSSFTVSGTFPPTGSGNLGYAYTPNTQLSNIQYYINSDVSAVDSLVQQQRLVGVNTMTHQANFQQIMVNLSVIVSNGTNPSSVYSSLQTQIANYLNGLGYLQPIRASKIIQTALQTTGVIDARLANTTDSKTYYGIQVVNPFAYYDSISDYYTGGSSSVDYRDIVVISTNATDLILNSNQLPELFRVNVYFRSQNDF